MEKHVTPRRTVVIVGRPNVGKSALFNRIAHRRIAIVHDQSGVTRDRIVREVAWHDERFHLVDTGGIRLFDGTQERDVIEMCFDPESPMNEKLKEAMLKMLGEAKT